MESTRFYSNSDRQTRKALVVDDDPICLLIAGRALKALGYEIAEASNGEEAIQRAGLDTFDLVLIDIHMPVLNGLEVSHQLRIQGATFPIIGITGDAKELEQGTWKESGMDACLPKPFHVDSFQNALRNVG